MSENVITLTDTSFDELINSSDVPVVVDLWAEWCGPCKMIAPTLAEIATEQAGAIKIAKLNIDENPQIPQRYGVMSIPTMLIFRNGELEKRVVGAKPKSALLAEFGF